MCSGDVPVSGASATPGLPCTPDAIVPHACYRPLFSSDVIDIQCGHDFLNCIFSISNHFASTRSLLIYCCTKSIGPRFVPSGARLVGFPHASGIGLGAASETALTGDTHLLAICHSDLYSFIHSFNELHEDGTREVVQSAWLHLPIGATGGHICISRTAAFQEQK